MLKRFVNKPKMSKKPIKNSKPIIKRATNGANLQPPIPSSTNVYSKGSIGYSFVYPLNKNTKPIIEQIIKNEILSNIGFIVVANLPNI